MVFKWSWSCHRVRFRDNLNKVLGCVQKSNQWFFRNYWLSQVQAPDSSEEYPRNYTLQYPATEYVDVSKYIECYIGQNPTNFAISKETIRRARIKNKKDLSASIKAKFNKNGLFTVHWDGKLMKDNNIRYLKKNVKDWQSLFLVCLDPRSY